MIGRRTFFAGAATATVIAPGRNGRADPLTVIETMPGNNATVDGTSRDVYVRFNQPVDHIHSKLLIKRDGNVVRSLQPRFQTAPEVLFARAPTLAPGKYSLHWIVRTLAGSETLDGDVTLEGEVSFSVSK
jgi:methionine-rich copper-binding protein CopC